ncbi:hypothetical protein ACFWN2_44540 [Lentzea sp. NPDC058436]|uniref:hypothetical protein n=1 Tax=Lentzea sp. NPDC058436 TaxID=3346499 RepID=UPI0036514499
MEIRRSAPELTVAAVTLAAGLWGYFAFFLHEDTRDLGTALLMGAYAANGLLQVCLAVYLRTSLSPREKLAWGFDTWPSRGGPSGVVAAVAWLGPVAAGLVVMLVATPASTPWPDDDFGIHVAILLLSLLGLAAVPLGAVLWLFAVLPLTALVGVFLPDERGRSRAEVLSRSWLLPVVAVFGTIMATGRSINRSEAGRWFAEAGLPLAALLAAVSIVAIVVLVVVHERARAAARR